MRSKKIENNFFRIRLRGVEKLLFYFTIVVLGFVKETFPFPQVLCLFLLLWVLAVHRASCRKLFRFLLIPFGFAIVGLLGILLVIGNSRPDTLLVLSDKVIPLSITRESLGEANIVFWRIINLLLASYYLLFTTSRGELFRIIQKLRIPGNFVEMGILSYRYIRLLDRKTKDIYKAQQLRLGYSTSCKSLISISLLLSVVFGESLRIAKQNFEALACRGYGGQLFFPSEQGKNTERLWVFLLIVIIGFILVMV